MENLSDYINEKTVIKDEQFNSIKDYIICQICKDIIIIPIKCSNCKNSFCRNCIEMWDIRNKDCPFRCRNPNYKKDIDLEEDLSKLKFECKKCQDIINYKDIVGHFYSKCGIEEINKELYDIENPLSSEGIFEKIEKIPESKTINCK